MEIYIAVNGENSEAIRKRLEFEEISAEYKINAEEMIALLQKKGYEVHRNGLFRIVEPNDEKIVIYTDEIKGTEIISVLFDMPLEKVKSQFELKSETLTKFWIQNYAEGFSAPRCIFLNDNTHNCKEL